MLLGGSVMASVFYLHADMPANATPLDKTLWFDAPSGGADMGTAPFTGNRFDVNGKILRTPNSSTTTSTFGGTIVVSAAGAGLAELHTLGWNLFGMDVNNAFQMRIRVPTVNLSVTNLVLGSSGDLKFRTLTGNNNLNFSIANLSGAGSLEFGDSTYANDTNGVWSLSITDTTPEFTGTIDLTRGQLTFGNSFVLGDATFAINSAQTNRIVLANSVSFSNVTFGAGSLAEGTYTASELNTAFSTDRFSGVGTMTVVPEPATIGMLGLGALATLMLRRMRRG
jgi:hypothetical protein